MWYGSLLLVVPVSATNPVVPPEIASVVTSIVSASARMVSIDDDTSMVPGMVTASTDPTAGSDNVSSPRIGASPTSGPTSSVAYVSTAAISERTVAHTLSGLSHTERTSTV